MALAPLRYVEPVDPAIALWHRSEDDTGIELRIVPDLGAVWQQVIGSTLEFSGIRLRNLQLPASVT